MRKKFSALTKELLNIDRKYISEGLFYMSATQGIGIATAAISAYFFANYLDKGVYGTYQFVLTMFGVMSIFTLRGVGKQIVRSYVKDGLHTLIPKTIQFIKFALPASLIGFVGGGYFFYRENTELAISLFVISAFFPFISGLVLNDSILLAKRRFLKQSILNCAQAISLAAAMVSAIILNGELLTLIITYCASQTAILLLSYMYVVTTEVGWNKTVAPEKTKAEYHLSLGESILEIGKLIDRLAVFSILGATHFAVYMIALLPIRELNRLPTMVRSLVLPKFSQYEFRTVQSKAIRKTSIFFVVLLGISILYALTAPFFYNLIFPLYSEAVVYTQILVFFLPFSSMVILSQALTVFDKTRQLYQVNVIYSLTAIVITPVLTITFGIWGAVFAKIITLAIRFLSLLYMFLRKS